MMKPSKAWAACYGLVGAALLVWSSTAAGQTAGGAVGAGSRVGGTSGTTGGGAGSGYSLSGGTSGTGLGTGGTSAMGAAGSSALGGTGSTLGSYGPATAAGGATNIPSSGNLFASYYVNPMSVGKPGATGSITGAAITAGTARFGTPLYATSSTGTGTLPGVTGTLSSTPGGGLSNLGATGRRGPAYTCTLVFPYDPPKLTQLQTDLQQIISGSSALTSKNIKVKLDGQTLVLEGSVSNDRERRLAEGLVRLTPGVRQVRNTLVVKSTQATPKPGS